MHTRPIEKVIQTENFEITIHVGNITEFHVCFEHNELGDECRGELWFDPMKELLDYDGVSELPKEVVAALKAEGYWGEGAVDIRAYEEEHSDWTYLTDKYAHSVVKF